MAIGSNGLALALVLAVLFGAVAPVAAASTPAAAASMPAAAAPATSVPLPPAAYYGPLTVDGEPAPAGLTVTAEIDGEVRGSITTDRSGSYGGAGAFDPKLQVDGTGSDDGATVQFHVEGQPAGTATWQSGDVREVALSATDVSTPEQSPAGGSGGGGFGAPGPGAAPGQPGASAEPAVTVTSGADGVDVEVTDAQAGRAVVVETGASGAVGLERVTLTPLVDGSFTMTVRSFESPPSGTPALPAGSPGVGFVQIDHSIADADVDDVTFRFAVSAQRLADRGLDPADVAFYRLHDGQWTSLPTSVVGQSATDYAFEASSPGLSLFAVGQLTDQETPADADDGGDDTGGEDSRTPSKVGGQRYWAIVGVVLAVAALAGSTLLLQRRR